MKKSKFSNQKLNSTNQKNNLNQLFNQHFPQPIEKSSIENNFSANQEKANINSNISNILHYGEGL